MSTLAGLAGLSAPTGSAGGNEGGAPPSGTKAKPRRRRRHVLHLLLVLALAAGIVLTLLASSYQPLAFGGVWGSSHAAGLPDGVGIRSVNTFLGSPGDLYIPPQRGSFALTYGLLNNGPATVSVDSVSLYPPSPYPSPGWPLELAGKVLRYPAGHPSRVATRNPLP